MRPAATDRKDEEVSNDCDFLDWPLLLFFRLYGLGTAFLLYLEWSKP